ncbi:LysR substrate-binding domain-containing protein [Patulibacter sp. SYSU D01012]|uniref:LysR substrate-binding domain-containing protein n=1 Tax=Patulibacter sp. SYSU D01012 TaxID=2817381 RepID=UPI001B305FE0|nr:LysR substrate-binding domain-containing protein [Patulibacter sp. SYSU D01012]
MDVELRHLRYFVAVAEELHFGRAAARLHMAQPPLSQAIRRLEDAVGVPLLARTSRSVRLTPAGAAFLDRARRTLRAVEEDVEEARSIGRGATGRLNVGFVGSAMLTTLPGVLGRYVAAYPGVRLRLHESFTSRVVAGMRSGEVDAGIVRDAEPVDGLEPTPVLTEPFVAVLPRDHPAADADALSVGALADTPFVLPPRAAGARAFEKPLALCEEHGFRPRVAHEATHWLTILRLVGAGLGVSLAPACVRHVATPEVACVALEDASVLSELTLLRRAGEDRPMVHAFAAIATGGDAEGDVLARDAGGGRRIS